MKKVLLATEVPFWKRSKGNQQRISALVEYLQRSCAITVFFIGMERPPRSSGSGARYEHVMPYRGLQYWKHWALHRLPEKLRLRLIRLMNSLSYTRAIGSFRNEHALHAFQKLVTIERFDALIIEYVWNTYLLDALGQSRPLTFLDVHDVFHKRMESYSKYGRVPDKTLTREQEVAAWTRYDYLIAIQQREYDYLDELLPGRVILAMHPQRINGTIYAERLRSATVGERLNVVYFASFGDLNVDAIEWFAEEVWDEQLAARFRLAIYGTVCAALRIRKPGIEIKGVVEDVGDVYRDADVVVNPVRFGSGLKIKNVEAIAHGVPLITSRVGMEGLEQREGCILIAADTPPEYKEALMRLTEQAVRREMSEAQLVFARANLAPESCFKALSARIETA